MTNYYPFTTDATDSVGGANGTLYGGASITGGYLALNGSDAYVQIGSHIIPTSGSYSVAFWAQQYRGGSPIQEFVSQGYSTGPGFYVGTNGSTIRVTDLYPNTISPPTDEAWHSYALTVDSVAGTSALYLDGALMYSFSQAIAAGASGTNTRFGEQFGTAGGNNTNFNEFLNGNLDDMRVYSGVLSSTEIAALTRSVPEPATIALIGIGLAGLGFGRRKRRS